MSHAKATVFRRKRSSTLNSSRFVLFYFSQIPFLHIRFDCLLIFLAHSHIFLQLLFSARQPSQCMFSIVRERWSVFFPWGSYFVTGSFTIIVHRFFQLPEDVGLPFRIDLGIYILSPTTFDFPKTFNMLVYLTTRWNSIRWLSGEQSSRIVCVLRFESCRFSVSPIQLHPNGPSLATGHPGSPRTSALHCDGSALSTPSVSQLAHLLLVLQIHNLANMGSCFYFVTNPQPCR